MAFVFFSDCDIGQYGHNCNETCGHCNNATQCSTVTGTCRTGCEAGYIGRLCKDGLCNFFKILLGIWVVFLISNYFEDNQLSFYT